MLPAYSHSFEQTISRRNQMADCKERAGKGIERVVGGGKAIYLYKPPYHFYRTGRMKAKVMIDESTCHYFVYMFHFIPFHAIPADMSRRRGSSISIFLLPFHYRGCGQQSPATANREFSMLSPDEVIVLLNQYSLIRLSPK